MDSRNYKKELYWGSRKEPNNNSCIARTPKHISLVRPYLDSGLNILEYGAGVGRMVELYESEVSFYDISQIYKDRLISKCEEKGLKVKQYVIDQSGEIKTVFKDKEFDVVCVFEVLLHSPPSEIKDLMRELSRIGKRVMVITWYEGGTELNSDFCWTRDYKDIVNDLGLNLEHWDELSLDKQVFFIYS